MINKKLLFIAAAVILFIIYAYATGFECIFLKYFGFICPGCGMTRALKSILILDFRNAFIYHPMVFCMPIVFVYIIKDGKVFKNKFLNLSIIIFIGAGFLINYLIKIIYN